MSTVSSLSLRILLHDFAGHPFQAQLSRELASRGHTVAHAYCGGVTTGRGDLRERDDDPPSLHFVDVFTGRFERYDPLRRLVGEVRYGRAVARLATEMRPDVVVSANTPLVAQALLWRIARRVGARRVYWLQDFLGRGAHTVLSARSALLGASAGQALETLETRLLCQADAVIAIADDFVGELESRNVTTPAVVIENWAPLDELAVRGKDNAWSRKHGLVERPVALYAGTLGLKHDPDHLVRAAQALEGSRGVVVVMSEGRGREALEAARAARGLRNLLLVDFVPYDVLSDVLGTADVCLVLLEAEAGTFSVPSKVLSYLAAGRAIVGAMPGENLGAKSVVRAEAGVVVEPGNYAGFARAVCDTLNDPAGTRTMGAAARSYAEATFDVAKICDRVLPTLTS